MKILFVQHMNGISGSELYLLQLLPALKENGIDAEALIVFKENTGRNNSFVEQLSHRNIVTHQFYGSGPYSFMLLFRIKKLLQENKYTIIQSNLIHADYWMAMVKLLFHRQMKLISVKHGFDEAYSAKYGFNTEKLNRSPFVWVQRLSGYMMNKNVTISKGIYDLYVKGKITKPSKIQIVYYGLNLDHIQNTGFQNTDNTRYAIILGRLVKYKGHEYLIKAWQKIKQADPSLKLYIVGNGAFKETLMKQAAELGLNEQVHFLGFQPNPHQLLHFAKFSIVTSIFEGFGLITLESWHHNRPVIAFDVPALNEIIDSNVNGILITPFDTDELAQKIIHLFKSPEDANEMGEKGNLKLKQDYNLERMTKQMISIYQSL